MLDNLKTLYEIGGIHAVLGVIGGGAKVALGLNQNESLIKEVLAIVFIAMPFGWLGGGLAQEADFTQYTVFSIAVVTGLVSHNIAKAILDLGIPEVVSLITGKIKDK